jgi:pimeloyl-ACP methyl ester carboxylesterase
MRRSRRAFSFICALIGCVAVGCSPHHDATIKHAVVAIAATQPDPPPPPYHLHLNGIGGYRFIDKYMLVGLQDGGVTGDVRAYDWTGVDVGLGALLVDSRHREQAKKVAELITEIAREQPGRRITLSTHSAGAGIAVWALAQLPDDVNVDSILMLAPALSPQFDLSPALRHVTGKLYAFYSPYDGAVLGLGTKMFGTVDGVKTEAAGKVGFKMPTTADPNQYEKLVQVPYDSAWMRLGNIGDHIGTLNRAFAREVLAPLMLTGQLPRIATAPGKKEPISFPPPRPTSKAMPTTIPTTAPAAAAATPAATMPATAP